MSGYNEAVKEAAGELAAEKAREMFSDGEFDDDIREMILEASFDDVIEERISVMMNEGELDYQIRLYLEKILSHDLLVAVIEHLGGV